MSAAVTPYYSEGGITIYHGDCRQIAPLLGPFDLLLTDPPYGIGADRRQSARANKKHGAALAKSRDYGVSDWDHSAPEAWVLGMALSRCRWSVVWGGNYFALPPARCWLVWDKDNGNNGYADCELAWTNLDKAVRRIKHRWMGMLQEPGFKKEERQHPTQKPEPVMRWAIGQAPEDCASVFDPFAGSGTTLVAAKALGKMAVGIEAEERYCEIAASRLSQHALPLGAA